jgi:hypothetical protein
MDTFPAGQRLCCTAFKLAVGTKRSFVQCVAQLTKQSGQNVRRIYCSFRVIRLGMLELYQVCLCTFIALRVVADSSNDYIFVNFIYLRFINSWIYV